jgi:predicted phosphodiesterase
MIIRKRCWGKLAFCLQLAEARRALPIILGDLFHVPRDNPNALLVALIEMFRPQLPWVLVGNHDKHEARLTRDVSLAVLDAAGVICLLEREGPVASLKIGGKSVLLGASPDWTPIPRVVESAGHDFVVWVTHHDLRFPGYEAGKTDLREIPGVDLVVNGHIHASKAPQRHGQTLWCNPGSIVRLSLSLISKSMHPAVTLWTPAAGALETLVIPHRPFDEVFPSLEDQKDPAQALLDESMFIRGLENLALRRTTEGVGLKAFLEANLEREDAVDRHIWELYEEIMTHGKED